MFEQQFEPAAQNLCTLFGGAGAPVAQGGFGGFDGAYRFGTAHQRHAAQQLAVGRVGYLQAAPIIGVAPAPSDVGLLAEQLVVIEFHARHSESRRRLSVQPAAVVISR
ncbi:hypothetical protein D3C84_844790 [compost metagenome]